MQEGKRGNDRHSVLAALQAFDRDAQKKRLPDVLNLKAVYHLYLKTDLICPEHRDDLETSKIPVLLTEIAERWTIPSEPIIFYVGRLAQASVQTACRDVESQRSYADLVYPCLTSRLRARNVIGWNVHTAAYCCVAPISNAEKWQIFEEHFLHKHLIGALANQQPETICMVARSNLKFRENVTRS